LKTSKKVVDIHLHDMYNRKCRTNKLHERDENMNKILVTIELNNGTTQKYEKLTKWDVQRLNNHIVSQLSRKGIEWNVIKTERMKTL
jgi:hypothetical protein